MNRLIKDLVGLINLVIAAERLALLMIIWIASSENNTIISKQ